MSTVTIVAIEDDDVGEVEGAFDEEGNLIHSWARNDASWSRYLDPVLEGLGYRVKHARPKGLVAKLKEEMAP
jgi:hypothetical protein